MATLPFQDLPSPGTAALPLQFHCSELVKMMQTHTEAQSVRDLLLNEEPGAKKKGLGWFLGGKSEQQHLSQAPHSKVFLVSEQQIHSEDGKAEGGRMGVKVKPLIRQKTQTMQSMEQGRVVFQGSLWWQRLF